MTTLTDLRTRLRQELHDTGDSPRWDDDALDRHLAHAIAELSKAMPREMAVDLATTPGSQSLPLAGLMGLLEVERVEYPIDDCAPRVVSFEHWGDTVTFVAGETPEGDDARVRYTAAHLVDEAGSTLSTFQEELALMGAGAFAALELAAGSIDTITTGGPTVPAEFQSWAQARLIAFRQLLHQYGRRPVMRVRQVSR